MMNQNEQQLQRLTGQNHEYAVALINYLQTDLRVNPKAVNDSITDILDGLVEAQANNQSARKYFGNDPETAAEAILAQLPSKTACEWVQSSWPLVNSMFIFWLLAGLTRQPAVWFQRDAVNAAGIILILVMFALHRGASFNRVSAKTKRRSLISLPLLLVALIALIIFGRQLLPGGISGDFVLTIGALMMVLNGIMLVKYRSNWSFLMMWSLFTASVWGLNRITIFNQYGLLSAAIIFACWIYAYYTVSIANRQL